MKKILMFIAMVMTSITMMAQSQFYVIMKDGSGASYPENIVDSLTFDNPNGAKIYGFEDLAKNIAQLRKEVDSLKRVLSMVPIDSSLFIHEYVDLGLPSGTLWATCNVGAKTPSDYGYYICWGETGPKSNYGQTSGRWNGEDRASLRSKGVIDQYFNLTSQYDAATVLWGEEWRTPTGEELEELVRYCRQDWVPEDGGYGVCGIKFTSISNGKNIFIPCAGMKRNNEDVMVGTRGYYMSATSEGSFATDLYLSQESVNIGSRSVNQGIPIRAVRKRANDRPFVDPNDTIINGHAYVDLGLPSGTLWATLNIGADSAQKVGNLYLWGLSIPKTETPSAAGSGFYGQTLEELIQNNATDSNGTLLSNRDAAYENWGGQWRMPTHEECSELMDNCSQDTTTINGVRVWEITGRNGKKLYFPINDVDFGFSTCWSSSAFSDSNNNDYSYVLRFYDRMYLAASTWAPHLETRDKFLPIRPVVNR